MKIDLVEELYDNKSIDYFSLEREVIIKEIYGNNLTILDIGCGSGQLGEALKKKSNSIVYGVELNNSAYKKASLKLDQVLNANIETLNIPFDKNSFDYIVMGDVLEHLINPQKTLLKLKNYLNQKGIIIISVPNIRYWRVVRNLIFRNDWKYENWGTLDETHLRFFTKKSILRISDELGFEILKSDYLIKKYSKSYYINMITLKLFESFLASHIFLKIK